MSDAPQPVNYSGYLGAVAPPSAQTGVDFSGPILSALKANFDAKSAAENQARQAAQMAELRNKALSPTATAEDKYQYVLSQTSPQMIEQTNAAIGKMTEEQQQSTISGLGGIITAFRNGHSDIAMDLLRERADAYKNAGDDKSAAQTEAIIKAGEIDPHAAESILTEKILFLPKGKDTYQSILDANKAPHDINLTDANAAKAWAEAEKIRLENSRPKGTEIDTDARKIMNAAVEASLGSELLADQASNLSDAYLKLLPPSGLMGAGWETFKKSTGGQDAVTALKQEYVKLRNSDVLKNLPPGVASDKDIEIALKAFPDENANGGQIAGFLRGTAKLQRYNSAINRAKAEWVNQNGSLGPAMGDFKAGSHDVTKGTAFWDFIKGIEMPNVAPVKNTTVDL